jgi:CHRD domain
MRRTFYFALFAAVALIVVGSSSNAELKSATAADPVTVTLTGGAEVPGPGDPDGAGTATLTYNHEKGELCYELSAKNIQEATSAHIHEGAAGAAGDVKVTLKAPAGGTSKGCVSVDKALLKEIADKPGNFYVNGANNDCPTLVSQQRFGGNR